MFRIISKFILIYLLKWKIIGEFPNLDKFVIAVIPHTSNYDFILCVMIRSILREEINFVGKRELFNPLTSWFFKNLGGLPIDRSKKLNSVDSIVSIFKKRIFFRLAIAPEGTRKKVEKWKTGFYFISKGAKVPILITLIDYKKRKIVFRKLFYPTNNQIEDFEIIKKLTKG
tara:strand:+ start:14 stop:526 length:513 start_codon:yes stop_codon:yes gene_type:complete